MVQGFVWNARARTARLLIHFGLWVLPSCKYKTELLEMMWALNAKVHAAVALRKNFENFDEKELTWPPPAG